MTDGPGRRVACPRCGAAAWFAPANRWRPFCGERCASIDLGAWASEAYRLQAGPAADEPPKPPEADDAPGDSRH